MDTAFSDGQKRADNISQFDGTLVPVEDLGDLVVTIVSAEVQPASSIDQFPTWSSFTELHQATNRRTEDF